MAIDKIAGLIGIAVVIASAFVTVPHAFLILVLAGLIVGFSVAKADHVRIILTAVALLHFASSFGPAPHVGKYIAGILGYGAIMAMGAALMVILRNVYERFRPTSKAATS